VSNELMKIEATDGTEVLIEVDPPGGFTDVKFQGSVLRAQETLEKSLANVRAMAVKAIEAFEAAGPDHVELEFGVKFKAEASAAVFAKTAAEGHMIVRMSAAFTPSEEDDGE
jgi:hypothetical protein